MSLYCVKLDANGHYVATIGVISESSAGFRFLPNTSAHKASRKQWPTAMACIPAWTKRFSMRIVSKVELDELSKS